MGIGKSCVRSFRRGEAGFTLIELLIVIAVLGVLSGVAVPNVSNFTGSAKKAAANTEANNVKTAAQSYLADEGSFPADSTLLGDYMSGTLKAKYYFNATTGQIGRDTSTPPDGTIDIYVDETAAGAHWGDDSLNYDFGEKAWTKGLENPEVVANGTLTKP